MRRRRTPNEYIGHYTNEHKPRSEMETAAKLDEALGGEMHYEESGDISAEQGNYQISFHYDAVPSETSSNFSEKDFGSATFYEMTNFELQNTETGAIVSLGAILPPEYRVYFSLDSSEEECYVLYTPPRIVFTGQPTSPANILGLFHEVGHIYEKQSQKKEFAPENFIHRKVVDSKDLAEKLQQERDAWAYAFRVLRSAIDNDNTENSPLTRSAALAYAKQRALSTYQGWVESQQSHRSSMAHFAWDYADDFYGDEMGGYYETLEEDNSGDSKPIDPWDTVETEEDQN